MNVCGYCGCVIIGEGVMPIEQKPIIVGSSDGNEFERLYHKRVSAERVNSRLKDKRRLESHCLRGLDKIDLHCTLSVLTMNAMALAKVQTGKLDEIRLTTRRIA